MNPNVSEDLIQRAASALAVSGVDPDDVIASMVASGVPEHEAYLATRAALVLVQARADMTYEPNARKKKWVETLLTKREAIERAIGMPLGNMLGCGHWGCVFESTAPWVVKLSIDPTEGPIWSKIAGLVREEVWGDKGFVEIKSIHRITPDLVIGGRKRKVWAIVREGIEPVFTLKRGSMAYSEFTRAKYRIPEGWGAAHWSNALKQLGPDVEDLSRALSGLNKYQRLATAWHVLGEVPRSLAQRDKIGDFRSEYESREKIEYRISRVVETLNGPAFAPLGESLNMLASHGIYLRDVHLLNIGWHIARDADDWDRIVIFDPGHTPTASGGDIEEALIENARRERVELTGGRTDLAEHHRLWGTRKVVMGMPVIEVDGGLVYLSADRSVEAGREEAGWVVRKGSMVSDPIRRKADALALMVEWAGGSDPLVENRRVYHGTPHVFSMGEAQIGEGMHGPGFYFTTDAAEAERYATEHRIGQEPGVIECDVDLERPLDYFSVYPEGRGNKQAKPPRLSEDDAHVLRMLISGTGSASSLSAEQRIEAMQEMGYDGIVVDYETYADERFRKEAKGKVHYIVFDPTRLSCERRLVGREAL